MSSEISFGIVIVSDSTFAGTREDKCAPLLKSLVVDGYHEKWKGAIKGMQIVPDDVPAIQSAIKSFTGDPEVNVVITCGGTGFGPRDVTPEATKPLLEREAPGIVHALMARSLTATPMAALSRLTAGITKGTLVVNFPGSPKAVKECFEVLDPILPHAVALLRNDDDEVKQTRVCDRPRQSTFPMVSVEDADAMIRDAVGRIGLVSQKVRTEDALNYILERDVLAPEAHPPFPASIKDGYAVVAADGAGKRQVVGSSPAGATAAAIQPAQCVRICTGAPVPAGADAVVQVEDTVLLEAAADGEELIIEINGDVKVSQDIRKPGSDIRKGSVLLPSGSQLNCSDIALLCSMGIREVQAYRRPVVGLLSTGDELRPWTDPTLPFGQIRDSNKMLLKTMLQHRGFKCCDLGTVGDDANKTLEAIQSGFGNADVMVSTGGVSMGEKDHVKDVLGHLNFTIAFGRVNMKPGKPTTFAYGSVDGQKKLFFGLPGNPVSAFVTGHLFLLPALRQLSGSKKAFAATLKVQLRHDMKKLDPRPEFIRAHLTGETSRSAPGLPIAVPTDKSQISSRLLSNVQSEVLVRLPSGNDVDRLESSPVLPAIYISDVL